MKLPLESSSEEAIVVKSEFPGVVFLSPFETELGSKALLGIIVSEFSTSDVSVFLVVKVESLADRVESSSISVLEVCSPLDRFVEVTG